MWSYVWSCVHNIVHLSQQNLKNLRSNCHVSQSWCLVAPCGPAKWRRPAFFPSFSHEAAIWPKFNLSPLMCFSNSASGKPRGAHSIWESSLLSCREHIGTPSKMNHPALLRCGWSFFVLLSALHVELFESTILWMHNPDVLPDASSSEAARLYSFSVSRDRG